MNKLISLPLLLLILAVVIFFKPFLTQGKLPIPSDTIIGLYHPYRDFYANEYPNGIPYKNFLITDPVRQQYPWRELAIDSIKERSLPLWNPYTMAGTPLLANLQSAPFYPLNLLLFIFPFLYGWSLLIVLQPLLAGIFLYFYLNNLRLNRFASLLGALTFSFSGFIVAWLEWGTIGHAALWLPFILLAIDKLFSKSLKQNYVWSAVLVFSLSAAMLAGHLQTFFYLFVVSLVYFFARWFQNQKPIKTLLYFGILICGFLLVTAIQLISTFQFIAESARSVDQVAWDRPGWFIPWQHLIQFLAPDFFGNPTTLNYWGEWNYGEFIGYVGILPLIMAIYALYTRLDKKTFFFGMLFFLSLLFSLPTFFAQIPYQLQIPFLSTTQPTRLLFITDFALAVLAAFGFDYFLKTSKKIKILYALGVTGFLFAALWAFVLFGSSFALSLTAENIAVAKRNLYIPTFFFIISSLLLIVLLFNLSFKKINRMLDKNVLTTSLVFFLLGITVFDLLRFSQKFTPFTDSSYLFPSTKALTYLQQQKGQFRIMSTDSRILPPNFSTVYRLQSLDGYDPLYLLRYGELMAAIKREKPDITSPFGFNRIITPQKYDSRLIDLLGVQYVLSLSDIKSPKLQQVFTEGQTQIYKNNQSFSRAFFVENIIEAPDKKNAIAKLFDTKIDLHKTAIVEESDSLLKKGTTSAGTAEIISYKENKVIIKTQNKNEGFLVLMDSYYPTWKAKICSSQETDCAEGKIFITNYNFRGIVVPVGEHHIIFYNSLL